MKQPSVRYFRGGKEMKPEEIKERIELIDVFFAKDEISNESLTQN
jgi:hypothetical protein